MKFNRLILSILISALLSIFLWSSPCLYFSGTPNAQAQKKPAGKTKKKKPTVSDGKNRKTGKKAATKDPGLAKYAIYQKTAPRPKTAAAVETSLPLDIPKLSLIHI